MAPSEPAAATKNMNKLALAQAVPRAPCSVCWPSQQKTHALKRQAAPSTAAAERLTRSEKEAGSLNAAAIPSMTNSLPLHSATSALDTDAASFGCTACARTFPHLQISRMTGL
jgi:hypothetical protein